jgi:outer membrane protein insertion porin family
MKKLLLATTAFVVLAVGSASAADLRPAYKSAPPPPPAPQTPPPQQKKDGPQQKKANPFEAVPDTTEAPKPAQQPPPVKPQAPKLEAPKPAEQTEPAAAPSEDTIEAVEFRGNRRVPADTLRALIVTKKGDRIDDEQLRRDFMILWNSNRFDDITLQREPGKTGWIVRFVVVERRVIRTINYPGMKSITVSEILDRFKERKIGLSTEAQYDPNRVQRARNLLYVAAVPDVLQTPIERFTPLEIYDYLQQAIPKPQL